MLRLSSRVAASCRHEFQRSALFPARSRCPKRRWFSEKEPKAQTTRSEPPPVEESGDLFLGTHIWRLTCAFGFVYIFTEYGMELTICEGPSMLPTIQSRGEIVVMDRFTPRWYGIQGGTLGNERIQLAKERQKLHEERLRQKGVSGPPTWHQSTIPVNKIPPEGSWQRFWERQTSAVSVGDVVVIQHPDRIGTVCKRVLGLPGDIVTKASRRNNDRSTRQRYRKGIAGGIVIPDGHMWLEGDNPWNSSDSRNYGPVPAALIVGRVLFRVWPLRGEALLERGGRPERDSSEEPQMTFSGSVVIPAGYENQPLVQTYEELLQIEK
jgi:signal peptidase I